MRIFFLNGLILCFAIWFSATAFAGSSYPLQFSSPDKKYTLRLEAATQPQPGEYGIVLYQGKKVISEFNYILEDHIVDILWNSSDSYFAINNRHAIGGDFIWIFSLPTGVAVKRPDDLTVGRTLIKVHNKYPQYSDGNLRGHYTFACEWRSDTELLVCTILIFDNDHEAIIVVYDTYTMGADGGYLVKTQSIDRIRSGEFDRLPKELSKIWTGWNSTWWKIPGKEPAGR
jgi:hypothetical protein